MTLIISYFSYLYVAIVLVRFSIKHVRAQLFERTYASVVGSRATMSFRQPDVIVVWRDSQAYESTLKTIDSLASMMYQPGQMLIIDNRPGQDLQTLTTDSAWMNPKVDITVIKKRQPVAASRAILDALRRHVSAESSVLVLPGGCELDSWSLLRGINPNSVTTFVRHFKFAASIQAVARYFNQYLSLTSLKDILALRTVSELIDLQGLVVFVPQRSYITNSRTKPSIAVTLSDSVSSLPRLIDGYGTHLRSNTLETAMEYTYPVFISGLIFIYASFGSATLIVTYLFVLYADVAISYLAETEGSLLRRISTVVLYAPAVVFDYVMNRVVAPVRWLGVQAVKIYRELRQRLGLVAEATTTT